MPRNNRIKVESYSSVVFVQVAIPWIKFSLLSLILRNLVSMQMMFSQDFVDLENAYNWVRRGKLRRVLQKYDIDGHLLMTINKLCCNP